MTETSIFVRISVLCFQGQTVNGGFRLLRNFSVAISGSHPSFNFDLYVFF